MGRRCALPQHSCKALWTSSAHLILAEIEVSQRCALRQHSRKAICTVWSDRILAEIEASQRCALPQHSCKTLCPVWSDAIGAEMEVSQRWALRRAVRRDKHATTATHMQQGCNSSVYVYSVLQDLLAQTCIRMLGKSWHYSVSFCLSLALPLSISVTLVMQAGLAGTYMHFHTGQILTLECASGTHTHTRALLQLSFISVTALLQLLHAESVRRGGA